MSHGRVSLFGVAGQASFTMRSMLALALIASVAVANAALPTFPQDWTSDQTSSININQGGIQQPDGSICCPATSPQCKVQTAFQEGTQYFDFTNERAAFKNPDGSGVVTLWADGKEYGVDASGACQSYCPVQGPIEPGLGFGNNTEDLGAATVNGVSCEHYEWKVQVPIINITMQVSDFYVKVSGSSGIPVQQIDHITPMGQNLGAQNTTYKTFKAGTPPASVFTVTGKSTCKIDQSCSGKNDDMPSNTMRNTASEWVIAPRLGYGKLELQPVY